MCVIALAWKAHPRWRLVLAGNRDEFHARPSAVLSRWPDAGIIAGRDLEAGGTWLGITVEGRCAVVTNVRRASDTSMGLSRGLLVTDYLAGDVDAPTHALRLRSVAADYRPFNLLIFDANAGYYLTNRPQPVAQALGDGVHGLSNAALDTPWPKTRRLCARLQAWLDTSRACSSAADDFTALLAALADETIAADIDLPNTGIGIERERWLSSAFIRGESYGTRASTVLAIDYAGDGVIIERRFGPNGRFDGETRLPIEGRDNAGVLS